MINQQQLKELIYYDPDTGEFTWKVKRGPRDVGSLAGSSALHRESGKTYILIRVKYKLYKAHRLAFLYMTGSFPPDEVDHINGDGTDNRWSNLRKCTRVTNARNMRLPSNNTSGVTGVSWDKSRSKWTVYIKVEGERINLGRMSDFFEAVCARKSAENRYNFHKNHGSNRPL